MKPDPKKPDLTISALGEGKLISAEMIEKIRFRLGRCVVISFKLTARLTQLIQESRLTDRLVIKMFETCECHNSSLWREGPLDISLCSWSLGRYNFFQSIFN